MVERVDLRGREVSEMMRRAVEKMEGEVERVRAEAGHLREVLRGLNPEMVLRRGYAIVRGEMKVDGVVKITTFRENVTAVVKKVEKRR
jgi:exonuclease VII large subunit